MMQHALNLRHLSLYCRFILAQLNYELMLFAALLQNQIWLRYTKHCFEKGKSNNAFECASCCQHTNPVLLLGLLFGLLYGLLCGLLYESVLLTQWLVDQYNIIIVMWVVLRSQGRFWFSDLRSKNAEFFQRVKSHEKKFKLHEKAMHVKQQDINKWTAGQSKKELTERMVREGNLDFDLKQYISKFNEEHKGRINLLDFSNYATNFNDFKDNPISKQDMEVIREFQKRKIDQRLHNLATARQGQQEDESNHLENPLEYYQDVNVPLTNKSEEIEARFTNIPEYRQLEVPDFKKWFDIEDDFMMILLQRNTSTKVTTLNRVNYYRYLLFMGNGNGLISYGKSRDLTPEGALTKAIMQCKKNIIAIPLDHTCSMPRPINSRFQDYHIYLRPLPGFNSWGYPTFSLMLALSGISHVGFKVLHSGHNNYTLLHSFFKAVTQNTTPQDMAELEGFKLYRHRFIRPLTENQDHRYHLSR